MGKIIPLTQEMNQIYNSIKLNDGYEIVSHLFLEGLACYGIKSYKAVAIMCRASIESLVFLCIYYSIIESYEENKKNVILQSNGFDLPNFVFKNKNGFDKQLDVLIKLGFIDNEFKKEIITLREFGNFAAHLAQRSNKQISEKTQEFSKIYPNGIPVELYEDTIDISQPKAKEIIEKTAKVINYISEKESKILK